MWRLWKFIVAGCIRWGKFAAVDRDELRSRRRDDEEQTSRSAKRAYVNFVQGVQHQVWLKDCLASLRYAYALISFYIAFSLPIFRLIFALVSFRN